MHELKLKIKNVDRIREKIRKMGAELVGIQNEKSTYFSQVPGNVLKIRETEKGSVLFKQRSEGRLFEQETEDISDLEKTKERLAKLFGIRCIIQKRREFYIYKNFNISIDFIKELGYYLVIEGNDPEKILKELGFTKKDIIPKTFCELSLKK